MKTLNNIISTKTLSVLTLACAGFLSANANATLFNFETTMPTTSNAKAGDVQSINSTFDNVSQQFSWSHVIADDTDNVAANGFWLVVSNGPEPKTKAGQYAILYGDQAASRLTAYEYSGENNGNSFAQPGNFLGSWDLNSTRNAEDNATEVSFMLDATSINGAYTGDCSTATGNCDTTAANWDSSLWQGVAFDENIGYWFHNFNNSEFSYASIDGNQEITGFDHGATSFYDKENLTAVSNNGETVDVPVPASLPLFGLAIAAFFYGRRKA